MNALSNLLGTPLAQAIGWALLHLLWQGALVAAILAATLALLARQTANARYLASCGALLLLVVLGTATAYRAYDGDVPSSAGTPGILLAAAPATLSAPTTVSNAQPATAGSPIERIASFTRTHLPQIVLVWLTGVLFLSIRLLFGWLRAHAIAKRNASEAAPEWQRAAARLAQALKLRRAVHLLESAAVEVPTVIGWLRPVVLLPAATLTGLSTEQMEMILAHELAHIRRNDFFVNLMQAVVETLLFYHPAVWWISHRIRVEREHCCDDVAVSVSGKPLVYARALTRLEELRVEPVHSFVAANGGSLLGRIRRLAVTRVDSPNTPSRFVAGAALLAVLLALVIAPSLPLRGQQQKAEPPAPAPAPRPQVSQSTVDVQAEAGDENDDDAEAPDAEAADTTDDVIPAIAPRAIAEGVAEGVAGGIADGVIEGAMPQVRPLIALSPRTRPMIAIAPRAVLPALAAIDASRWEGAEATLAPDAPGSRRRHHRIGESGKLTVDDLIELRASGVTPSYIDAMRSAGLGELSLDDIASMKAMGVTPEYLRGLHDAGIKFETPRDIVELRALGVTGEYVSQMRAAGYSDLTTRQLTSLRAMGVSPAYVKQLADAGYRHLTANELVELRAQNITPEFIKSLNDAGYTSLSVKDLARMAAMGVNADFIRDLAKYKVK